MSGRARGVQEVRTLSAVKGSGKHSNERHVRQFQLAALELERTRRNREKEAALRRVRDIDRMLQDIDELIRKHQEALGLPAPTSAEAVEAARGEESEGAAPKRRVLRY